MPGPGLGLDPLRAHGLHLLARHGLLRDLAVDPGEIGDGRLDLVRTSRILAALPIVSGALGELPWAVVKGPVLDEHVYPSPGLRPYADLDVLVRPRDLEAVVTNLEQAGARLLDRNLDLARTQRRGELDLLLPGGAVLDLHWHLVNDAAARRSIRMPTDELLARRLPVSLAGAAAWRLDPLDALVHLAVHALTSGAERLIWAHDLRYSLQHPELDQAQLAQRAGTLAPMLDLMLERAATAAAFTTPPRLGRATLWTRAMRLVSRRRPMRLEAADLGTGRALFTATRPTTLRSIQAFLLAQWQERRRGAGGPTKHQLGDPHDSPAQRRAFFDAVVVDASAPAASRIR